MGRRLIVILICFDLLAVGLLVYFLVDDSSDSGPSSPSEPERVYEITAYFPEANALHPGDDVRIGGVSVGTVFDVAPSGHGETAATLHIEPKYAPINKDAKAILRTKTLLGQTYVELTAGKTAAGKTRAVSMDEVKQALAPKARAEFRRHQRADRRKSSKSPLG